MWPTSAEFTALVRSTHRAVTVAQVWDSTNLLATLQPVGGQVVADRTRAVRRDLAVQLVDPDGTLTPDDAADLLAPFGNEIRAWRGIRLADGTDELVPLGVFRIAGFDVASGGDEVSIDVVGYDRSRQVARARFTDEYQIAAGADIATVLTDLLTDRYPTIELDLPDTGFTCGKAVLEAGESSDPWRDAVGIAAAGGYELAFDPVGVCRLYTARDPTTATPDAVYTDTGDCVLLQVARAADDEGLFSGVVVTGESSGLTTPVRGESWDDDPSSPTYRYGKFGEVPRFYASPFVTTADQAAAAAQAMLDRAAGAVETISWAQVVNPAHDCDDVLVVTEAGSGTNVRLSLDALTVPLAADQPMTGSGRSRRSA